MNIGGHSDGAQTCVGVGSGALEDGMAWGGDAIHGAARGEAGSSAQGESIACDGDADDGAHRCE